MIKNFAISFLLFIIVSCTALFSMKYILWAMFKWGGYQALGLALVFTSFYVGSFFAIKKVWTRQDHQLSNTTLKLIWVLGFIQLAVLGGLYHLMPQFFPAIVADFFFA